MTEIRVAKSEEYAAVRSFYHRMIDMMREDEYAPAWEKGVYPSDLYLKEAIENDELWVCECGEEYMAAMIVNHKSNEEYKSVRWSVEAEDHEVTVIHTLGVLPPFQGKGIAGAMVQKAIALAETTHQKAIRLDVLGRNIPAQKLYVKHGFRYVDTIKMFYEDTGWTDFLLYERNV